MLHFIHSARIYFILQGFTKFMEERRKHPEAKSVLVIEGSVALLVAYFFSDILYLFYSMWLMLHDATWTQGVLLLIIAALESCAVHLKISGAYTEDKNGFLYPASWLRSLTFAESMFILLRLFEGA
jgi:hypothetical protein